MTNLNIEYRTDIDKTYPNCVDRNAICNGKNSPSDSRNNHDPTGIFVDPLAQLNGRCLGIT